LDLVGGWALPAAWGVLGLTIVTCGALARDHARARTIGIGAVSLLWVVFGAGANAAMLADGTTYGGFADASPIPFVHDTWQSLVVPHHHAFIGLLIAGEAAAGILVLAGRTRQVALLALIAFNLTLVVFGWAFAIWGAPVATGLALLARADRTARPGRGPTGLRNRRPRPSAGASSGRHRSPRSRVPSP
jgi:hypothetical protein